MSAAMKVLRAAVFARAGGRCEGCWRNITEESGQLDHVFGRAKQPECLENCMALCLKCHSDKTCSRPSAASWLEIFIIHCRRLHQARADVGEIETQYARFADMAETKLAVLRVKGLA